MLRKKNLLSVMFFSIAMAYLESAVVVYLREMYNIVDLVKDTPLKPDAYTIIEIGREAATIVMLAVIGLLAGSTWPKKIGYFFLSFGVWDIFYYIWLYVFIQWPKSLFEWDILFLIPLPWWGPVIAPVLISLLLILTGYLLISEAKFKVTPIDWAIFGLSIFLILFTFMEDSIKVIFSGTGDLTEIRLTVFSWILFLIAYVIWIGTTIKVFYLSNKK